MSLINPSNLLENVNITSKTPYKIVYELKNSCAQFIMDLSTKLNISFSMTGLAIHLVHYFFFKNSYINYDRFIMSTACIILACKILDTHIKLDNVCASYLRLISETQENPLLDEQKMQKIRDKVCIYEAELLKTINYNLNYELGFTHIEGLVMQCNGCSNKENIYIFSRILLLDIYRAGASIFFNSKELAVTAVAAALFFLFGEESPASPTQKMVIENNSDIIPDANTASPAETFETKILKNLGIDANSNNQLELHEENDKFSGKVIEFIKKAGSDINIDNIFKILNMLDEVLDLFK